MQYIYACFCVTLSFLLVEPFLQVRWKFNAMQILSDFHYSQLLPFTCSKVHVDHIDFYDSDSTDSCNSNDSNDSDEKMLPMIQIPLISMGRSPWIFSANCRRSLNESGVKWSWGIGDQHSDARRAKWAHFVAVEKTKRVSWRGIWFFKRVYS